MDENYFKEKLRRIEALFSGAATPGERDAAGAARERILLRLKELQDRDPATEWKFTLEDAWDVKVFCALCRRYDLRPYRYYRQRRTTVMVRAPNSFVDTTLWPEFSELSNSLRQYLTEVTDRLISSEIHKDTSEAEEVAEKPALGHAASSAHPTSPPPTPRPAPAPPPPAPASRAEHAPPPRPPPPGPPPSASPASPASARPGAPVPLAKVGRNDPCPCGSRRKFKKCHGRSTA